MQLMSKALYVHKQSFCITLANISKKIGISYQEYAMAKNVSTSRSSLQRHPCSLVIMAWAGEEQTITLTKSKKTLWRHDLLNMWHKTSLRYMFPNSPCNKKSLFPFDILELTPVYWLEREWLLDFATQFCNPFESDLWEDEWLTPYRVNIYQHKQ